MEQGRYVIGQRERASISLLLGGGTISGCLRTKPKCKRWRLAPHIEGGAFESMKNTQAKKMQRNHTRYTEEKCRCTVFEDGILLFEAVRDIELKIACNLHIRIAAIARPLVFPDDAQDPVDRLGVNQKPRNLHLVRDMIFREEG